MKNNIFKAVLILLTVGSLFGSCVRKSFDNPPIDGTTDPIDPATGKTMVANKTILDLKQSYNGAVDSIAEDWIISGVVISSDAEGSFYKEIIIQDTTGGISIKLDKQGTHYEFPIGRRVYVKLKGLTMSNYGKFIQVGYTMDITNSLVEIPGAFINKFVFKGQTGQNIKPKKMTIPEVLASVNDLRVQGTLIEIDDVQFPGSLNGATYAQAPSIASGTDRNIQDCATNSLIVRMSGYSQFQSKLLPTGKGTARLIASRYNNNPQMLISSPSNLPLTGARCAFGSATDTLTTISDLRNSWTVGGAPVTINNRKIRGVVISNGDNTSNRNLIIQERGGKGMTLRFKSGVFVYDLGFGIGDSVEVLLNGVQMGEFNGLLQIGAVAGSELAENAIQKLGAVTPIQPKTLTMAAALADWENLESTLVKINTLTKTNGVEEPFNSGATSTGGNSGNISVTDDGGTTTMTNYVASWCPWKANACKVNLTSITGVLIQYISTRQITPRLEADIVQ